MTYEWNCIRLEKKKKELKGLFITFSNVSAPEVIWRGNIKYIKC